MNKIQREILADYIKFNAIVASMAHLPDSEAKQAARDKLREIEKKYHKAFANESEKEDNHNHVSRT
jgi:hypothetical protein